MWALTRWWHKWPCGGWHARGYMSTWRCGCKTLTNKYKIPRPVVVGRDSSVVRAPDSWSKGRGFESLLDGRIFFSRVNFLCWRLFRYPFHPRVTAVARKRQQDIHSAKSAGGRLQLNTHTPYVCGFAWSDMMHGCMVYTERAEMAAVSCGTSHASAVSTPLRWIFKKCAIKS